VGFEVVWEYCSMHDLRFAGASVAVGAGRAGAVVLGMTDSVVDSEVDSESEEVVVGSADFLPVSWDTKTPVAIDARMMNTKASPHY
jgi:hypothetical protein